jgi:glycosyltransferase involved in cell wall biosynthesis
MKKLLILTQYYPPEIGAPQNRLHELAVRLQKSGIHVEVLTAMPNYPKMEIFPEYKTGKLKEETIDEIKVHRSRIFVSKSSGIISRLLNYFSFVWTSYWRGRKLDNFDFLMVESPPLFLGYSAMALSQKLNAKLIFNVSDLWPESAEKLGIVNNKFLLGFAYRLEKKCYDKATLITGQTQGIVDNITNRFGYNKVHWLPNGVNLDFYNPALAITSNLRQKENLQEEDVLFFYGGIIGHAQGLETLLFAAEKVQAHKAIKIILQGAGPVKLGLMDKAKAMGLTNVIFREPVPKDEMPSILKAVDVALVPLKKLSIFEGAIPSKIFEALSMEIPLLLAVGGEAKAHFVDNAKCALYCEPENAEEMAEKMIYLATNKEERIKMGQNGRIYANEHFNRNKIAENLTDLLNKTN